METRMAKANYLIHCISANGFTAYMYENVYVHTKISLDKYTYKYIKTDKVQYADIYQQTNSHMSAVCSHTYTFVNIQILFASVSV